MLGSGAATGKLLQSACRAARREQQVRSTGGRAAALRGTAGFEPPFAAFLNANKPDQPWKLHWIWPCSRCIVTAPRSNAALLGDQRMCCDATALPACSLCE